MNRMRFGSGVLPLSGLGSASLGSRRCRVLGLITPHAESDPLWAYLATLVELELTCDPASTLALGDFDCLLAQVASPISDSRYAQAIVDFVVSGGGLVGMGQTCTHWATGDLLSRQLGTRSGNWSEQGELTLRVADPDRPLTQRLACEFTVQASLLMSSQPWSQGQAVLLCRYRYEDHPATTVLQCGAGQIHWYGLDGLSRQAGAPLWQLIYRSLRSAADFEPRTKPVGVALLGYGAIGRGHGEAVRSVVGLQLRAVCDTNPERLREVAALFPEANRLGNAEELMADADNEVIVVSTPPNTHADLAMAALGAGKHVICEKPLCLSVAEADQMIELATARGRLLTCYQSRRWDPDFLAISELVRADEIGQVFYLETFVGGYQHPCGYWHSHEPVSGGALYDWGAHYFDWILRLIGEVPHTVIANSHKRVWHDSSNADQVEVMMSFSDGRQAHFMYSDIAAADKPKWYILGTQGAIVAEWRYESVKGRSYSGDLIEEHLEASESPSRVQVFTRRPGGPNKLTVVSLPQSQPDAFYRNLADHLIWGVSVSVPASEARDNVRVMEAASRSAAAGGVPVALSHG